MPNVPDRLLTGDEIAQLNEQEFWTVAEAAAFLRVGQGVIRTAIRRGTIPCFRVGTWMRIPRRRFLESVEAGALTRGRRASGVVGLSQCAAWAVGVDPPSSVAGGGIRSASTWAAGATSRERSRAAPSANSSATGGSFSMSLKSA